MTSTIRTRSFKRSVWAGMIAVGVCMLLLGYTVAGPVVQPVHPGPTQDKTSEPSITLPDSWGFELPSEEDVLKPKQRSTTRSTSPPASSNASPNVRSSTSGQQPSPQPAAPSNPQMMPSPPTYAPGSPGGPLGLGQNPYAEMPTPPTAFGPWDSPNAGAGGSSGPGIGGFSGGTTSSWSKPSSGSSGSRGYGGYGVSPPPAPTMSLGAAALNDPSFGRFEQQSVREATAPRQPASFGQTQSEILRGSKPFADYRAPEAYSPYLRLSRDLEGRVNPGTNTYYEWVKPMLEQQQENRQVNRNLQGLGDVTRAGHQTLESIRQRPGNTPSGGTAPRNPATYMNTGQYYPGFSRPR